MRHAMAGPAALSVPSRRQNDWKSLVLPRLESTNHIGGPPQAQLLQRHCCETRRIAFRTKHNHPDVMIGGNWQPRTRTRIEAPLQYVAFDNQRARDATFDRA